MTRAIEVIFEDNVFKPVKPVVGIKEHERMVALISPRVKKEGLRDLAGTLSPDEAKEMLSLIDEEFGKVEGDW
ncbi:MAG: hypothetical protein BWY45_03123 [Euryarchaeota archaeon ADurb.Bin294]|jgi:predicted DNA-binding antitoxin AbrB/MazE fold protein|nr:MAG: hypothetical protein BWY45_03123 [Euryarchaeota archaeon ADurb.Bin294]